MFLAEDAAGSGEGAMGYDLRGCVAAKADLAPSAGLRRVVQAIEPLMYSLN
jgi:hypothetical protein